MTALSDTLAAAQVRALAALERAYLRDVLDSETFTARCAAIGARDVLEMADLLACLDVLREYGATEPPQTNGQPPAPPISEKQRNSIQNLADERGFATPETAGMTAAKASELITALQRGTYKPPDDDLPF